MHLQILSAGSGIHPLRHCENPYGLYPYRGLPAFAQLSMAGSEGKRLAYRSRIAPSNSSSNLSFLTLVENSTTAARHGSAKHGAGSRG
jgi:hypothetical protein